MLRSKPIASLLLASSSSSRGLELSRVKKNPSRRYLRKSDLEDKLLITRTTGKNFGSVGEAWVDPRRLTVQNFDIITRKQIIKTEVLGNIELQTIREVGDVVLIHSEQDFKREVFSERIQLTTLPGLKLILDNGKVVGKVIDFVFDPETGRIVQLVFHTKNFPFAKSKYFDQFAVPVQSITKIVLSERVVYLKNSASWNKVGVGEYQFLANLIPSFDQTPDEEIAMQQMETYADGASSKLQDQYQALLEESRRQQEAYYARYGKPTSPRRSITRSPPSQAKQRAGVSRKERKIEDWLVNERQREELFEQ